MASMSMLLRACLIFAISIQIETRTLRRGSVLFPKSTLPMQAFLIDVEAKNTELHRRGGDNLNIIKNVTEEKIVESNTSVAKANRRLLVTR